MRGLVPSFSWGPWGGGLDDDSTAEAHGGSLLIVWLGFAVEICFGRVKP
jgi:hypothetical protein